MEIEYIAGRKERQQRRREKGPFLKRLAKGVKEVVKNPVKGFLKLNPLLIMGRNSLLTLIKLNFAGLATKMNRIPVGKLTKKWGKLGGNSDNLLKAIKQGRNKALKKSEKKKKGVSGFEFIGCNEFAYLRGGGIGADPITLSAVISSASAILLALKPLFKAKDPAGNIPDFLPGADSVDTIISKGEAEDPEVFSAGVKAAGGAGESEDFSKYLLPIGLVGVGLFLMNKKG